MDVFNNPIPEIQKAKHTNNLSYCYHALQRMVEREIESEQVEQALNCSEVEVLENYFQVGRPSPECLILGKDESGRNLHILVSYPTTEVITTYEPSLPKWLNLRERAKK